MIVGRCADLILKDTADCLTVFIHASLENRAERIVQLYGESDVRPIQRQIRHRKVCGYHCGSVLKTEKQLGAIGAGKMNLLGETLK